MFIAKTISNTPAFVSSEFLAADEGKPLCESQCYKHLAPNGARISAAMQNRER